ncbi:MAG: hypothetical protein BroJett038_31440 [Chloroflexota bacterium]|nr:MAG: hypothetical protein BroJett038_31440 [Chloroflexota bacterium]
MLAVNRMTRRDGLLLALVLLVAALMRLGEPGIIEFLHDEAMLSLMAQDWLAGGDFPLTGIPSSVGVPNPPISVYVLTLPYLLSSNPQFATLFIAALNVAGVGLLWWIAHRYLGRVAALAAGLAYALNPWAILYSRKIWAQDFHTPFLLLAIVLGLYGFGENKRWAQIACLPVLMSAVQIHFAAWALLPLYLVCLWIGRKTLSARALFFSFVLATMTLLPFLLGLSSTLQQDPNRIANAVARSGKALTLTPDALIFNARLATGLALETWVAPQQTADLLGSVPPPAGLWLLIGTAVVVGLAAVWRPPHRQLALLLIVWVGLPVAVFSITWTRVYPHYFVASIPALCLLAGVGLAWLVNAAPGKPYSRTALLAGFGVLLLTQGLWWRGLLRYLDSTATPEGFGPPMHYLLDARAALAQHDDVLVISDGFEILYDQEPAIWPVMLRDTARCVRALAGDGAAVFPAGAFAVLVAPNAPDNPLGSLYRVDEEVVFPLRPGEGSYRVRAFEAAPEWNGPALTAVEAVRFESGIRLTGYHLQADRMILEWQLPGPVEADYHYFGHFLDANGEKIGQRDNSLWPGRFWCAGDRLLTWADISLLPETAILRVGLYTLENGGFINASVFDETGNVVGTWADIPLNEW